jgi:cell division protein FtsB
VFLPAKKYNMNYNNSGDEESNISKDSSFLQTIFSFMGHKVLWGLVLVVGVGFLFYFLLSEDGLSKSGNLMEKKAILEEENLRLEEENRQLSSRLDRLNSDPLYLEDEARKKLGLVRPDEIIYRLAEEPDLSDGELIEQLN